MMTCLGSRTEPGSCPRSPARVRRSAGSRHGPRAVRPSVAAACSGSAARLGPQWRIPAWSRVIPQSRTGRITCGSRRWSAARGQACADLSSSAPRCSHCSRSRSPTRYIPGNPMMVPKNMPGAGSLVLANWLYNVAPKDGTAFGTIGRGTGFDPLLGSTKAHFDASKFNWIGSMNDEVSVCVAWHTTGVAKLEQVTRTELTVGGTGPAADTDQFPKVLNATIGTKFKVITGYPGGNDV